MSEQNGLSWAGVAMVMIGLFLVLRTVRSDARGNTLVNHLLGTAK
jgi:hypothetical protein